MSTQPSNKTVPAPDISAEDRGNLRHMLGIASNVPKKQWGYRNYYASSVSDMPSMTRLEAAGLVRRGRPYEDAYYFHATEAGCLAVGLSAKQCQNALNG